MVRLLMSAPEDSPTPLLTAALNYAAAGFHVIPLHSITLSGTCTCAIADCEDQGKHPRTANGSSDATTASDVVRSWWTRWPGANIGVATGKGGLYVVDLDGEEGLAGWAALEAEHGATPTRTVSTGRGRHLWYMADEKLPNSASRIAPKVDSRGTGGYVVAPPSTHISGRTYAFEGGVGDRPAQLPEWVAALVRKPKPAPAPAGGSPIPAAGSDRIAKRLNGLAGTVAMATEGKRNDVLNWAAYQAGRIVSVGLESEDTAAAMLLAAAARAGLGETESRKTVSSGLAAGKADPDFDALEQTTAAAPTVTTITASGEADFWAARPVLAHILNFARSRMASPWGVLGAVLTRVTVAQPPHYVLPATIGGHASLNLFCALVARSGGGKGASESAAADCVDFGNLRSAGVGSGEGILHQYVIRKKATKELPGGIEQHNKAVLFTASEVDTLGALHSRNSSTLLSEMRKVWMGEELSFAYVDPTKRLTVPRHAYRAGLIVGVQPARAGVLLDDTDGGTPQRFAWLPAYDRDIPDETPAEPEAWSWTMPVARSLRVDGRVILDVCATAVDTIKEEHRKRNRGEGDALNAHALLCRLKIAAALALLEERLGVSDDDWRLAGVVMDKSDETRHNVVTVLTEEKRKVSVARGLAEAEQESVRGEATTQRVGRLLAGRLASRAEWKHSDLRTSLVSTDRGYFDAAVQALSDAGQVEVVEGRPIIYRWLGGKR